MKKVIFGIVAAVGALTVLTVSAQQWTHGSPIPVGSTESCVIPKVDGERVPFPLQKANTKFELAEGETYLINGTLTVISGKVFLKVDFTTQPYLATAKMLANPYLEMASMDPNSIRHYNGKVVQVAVVTSRDGDANHNADLQLSNILPPVRIQ